MKKPPAGPVHYTLIHPLEHRWLLTVFAKPVMQAETVLFAALVHLVITRTGVVREIARSAPLASIQTSQLEVQTVICALVANIHNISPKYLMTVASIVRCGRLR